MATPTFNFKMTAVVHKRKASSGSSVPSHVQKLVGVVRIDEEARYFVRVYKSLSEFHDYDISTNSFPCKGKEVVWKFDEDSKRFIQWIRDVNKLHDLTYHWKPFKPGSVVKGYVNANGRFEIIKVKYIYIEEYSKDDIIETNSMLCYPDIIDAQRFYEEHIEEIQRNYKIKYGTTE